VSEGRLVYSTALGRVRQPDERPAPARERRTTTRSGAPRDGVVRLFRERGERGGKTVTVVRNLPGTGAELLALASELRRLCGAGGTVKDGVLEIQGDHRERIAAWLETRGHRVKLAGG
jgi:translation initiation factor 1